MTLFSIADLRILARRYCDATGSTPDALSARVFSESNRKTFRRLLDGAGCNAENAEKASAWFAENWPENVPWPDGVCSPREAA